MKRFFIIIIGILITLIACDTTNYRSSVPNTPVNYTVYITREYPNFVVENGFQTMVITERKFLEDYIGYAGLLIWVGMDNAYHAADLCCPNCIRRDKPLKVDGLYAKCEICDEHYDISYGYCIPTKGKTREPMKIYNTSYRNASTGAQLHIFN